LSDNQSDNSSSWGYGARSVRLLALNEIPYDEIDGQITLRFEMIKTMVGRLYPSILTEEIEKLVHRRNLGPKQGQLEAYLVFEKELIDKAKQAEISQRYRDLEKQQKLIREKTTLLQQNCKHPNATQKGESNTGNWSASDDEYWWLHECPDCCKRWTSPQ